MDTDSTPLHKPASWREGRRLRGWDLYQQGWKQKDIATALGVSEGAVSQWITRGEAGGVTALYDVPPPGRPVRMTTDQWATLPTLLAQGAEAFGWHGDVWTTERVAVLIRVQFGISYHPAHVSRILRRLRYTVQKPITRATQRDEAAITDWHEDQLPAIKKKAAEEERTIVWVDESAFYLLPARVRTYAPCGETPILQVPWSHDHLSVVGGLTEDGRVIQQMQAHAFDGAGMVEFLRHLVRQIGNKLLVIWDGAPMHRSTVVKEWLATEEGHTVWLTRLPAYAPDLNAIEGLWQHLKHHELANVCCRTLDELKYQVQLAIKRVRHKRRVLQGCLKQCA